MACRILVPQWGIEPRHSAVKTQSLKHSIPPFYLTLNDNLFYPQNLYSIGLKWHRIILFFRKEEYYGPWHACCCVNSATPWIRVHTLSQQEDWGGLPFPSPGDLPDPEIEPMSLATPALAGGAFITEPLVSSLMALKSTSFQKYKLVQPTVFRIVQRWRIQCFLPFFPPLKMIWTCGYLHLGMLFPLISRKRLWSWYFQFTVRLWTEVAFHT